MGIPLLAGRDFDERDAFDKPQRSDPEPLDREEALPATRTRSAARCLCRATTPAETPAEIVGVVGDVRSSNSRSKPRSNSTAPGRNGRFRS